MNTRRWLREYLPTSIYEALREAYFFGSSVLPRAAPVIGPPSLPESAIRALREALQSGGIYLEYGAGGSTLLAAQYAAEVISIDSDREYLAAVARQLPPQLRPRFKPIAVDLGWTGSWGTPVFRKPTEERVRKWTKYPNAPWRDLAERQLQPSVILIDGRFRVACALQSILALGNRTTCEMFFDDYHDREVAYEAILPFVTNTRSYDRLLAFTPRKEIDRARCEAVLAEYYRDYR